MPRKPIWTTAEDLSAQVEEEMKRIDEQEEARRVYNLAYYHTHKKPSQCDCCIKTLSSISALRRHQRDGMHCKLIKMAKEMAQTNNNTIEATEPATPPKKTTSSQT